MVNRNRIADHSDDKISMFNMLTNLQKHMEAMGRN